MGPPSKICKALGAVKDQTSISLAKVSINDTILADIDVAIVKATRHEECPADERHVREILSLTCYSRAYISACVNTLSRRLNKTKNWVVAIKTLMLIHRLVSEGDSAYEQEIYVATRRGTRLLNLSDFRDTSRSSGSWDFSAFVRTYGLYLDERLEYRMQSRRSNRSNGGNNSITAAGGVEKNEDDNKEEETSSVTVVSETKKKIERIFTKAQRLQQVFERFLACRPTGEAKINRMVVIALYPLVKESFQIYYDLAKIICIFVERFMELEIPDCVRVYEIFTRIGKQFDELDIFYTWCKSTGIARSNDYPEIDKITPKKLEVMDQFIREKMNLADYKRAISKRYQEKYESTNQEDDTKESDEEEMNGTKVLPPPEGFCEEQLVEEGKEDNTQECKKDDENQKEVDLLNLYDDENMGEEQVNKLALALFDGWSTEMPTAATTATSAWEAFEEDSGGDWETALVQSVSHLSNQKATLGGGFDMLVLDGMYQQSMTAPVTDSTGSASSVALWPVDGKPPQTMLALPSTSTPANEGPTTMGGMSTDPFAASTSVAPPSYVQMSEMEKKQKLLVEEQLMWQQYGANGMQGGHINGITNVQPPNYYAMGSYT